MQQGGFYTPAGGPSGQGSGNMQDGAPGSNAFGGWNGAGGPMGNVMNDATAQMGMQFGAQIAAAGGAYMEKNVSENSSLKLQHQG
jgi:protein transport protein YIF1